MHVAFGLGNSPCIDRGQILERNNSDAMVVVTRHAHLLNIYPPFPPRRFSTSLPPPASKYNTERVTRFPLRLYALLSFRQTKPLPIPTPAYFRREILCYLPIRSHPVRRSGVGGFASIPSRPGLSIHGSFIVACALQFQDEFYDLGMSRYCLIFRPEWISLQRPH